MSSIATSEEDIIKKRLLIEGDSGNEDKLINKLIKNFVKWTNSSFSNVKPNEDDAAVAATTTTTGTTAAVPTTTDEESSDYLYEQMMASLSHAEFGLLRNQFILEMNKVEQDNYAVLYSKINSEIERAKKKIVESKVDLQEARKIRKNRQEYDVIARQILNYMNRNEMQTTIKSLEDKVEGLKKLGNDYDRKIEMRRKQFAVVLQSLSNMKSFVESDDSTKPDDVGEPTFEAAATAASDRLNGHSKGTATVDADEMEDDFTPPTSHKKYEKNANEVEMEEQWDRFLVATALATTNK